jgi:hypothetical protein
VVNEQAKILCIFYLQQITMQTLSPNNVTHFKHIQGKRAKGAASTKDGNVGLKESANQVNK